MIVEDRAVEGAEPVGTWLVTFSDVIALLLAFFVMLFSMSEIKMEKWDQIISVQSSPEKLEEEVQPQLHAAKSVSKFKLKPALSLDYWVGRFPTGLRNKCRHLLPPLSVESSYRNRLRMPRR